MYAVTLRCDTNVLWCVQPVTAEVSIFANSQSDTDVFMSDLSADAKTPCHCLKKFCFKLSPGNLCLVVISITIGRLVGDTHLVMKSLSRHPRDELMFSVSFRRRGRIRVNCCSSFYFSHLKQLLLNISYFNKDSIVLGKRTKWPACDLDLQ